LTGAASADGTKRGEKQVLLATSFGSAFSWSFYGALYCTLMHPSYLCSLISTSVWKEGEVRYKLTTPNNSHNLETPLNPSLDPSGLGDYYEFRRHRKWNVFARKTCTCSCSSVLAASSLAQSG